MHKAISQDDNAEDQTNMTKCTMYEHLKPSEYTDYKLLDIENDIDPDNHFFSTIRDNCRYYTDEQFNQDITLESKLSIIHFNSRSMYANFNDIKVYISRFKQPFNIIAISETWIVKS